VRLPSILLCAAFLAGPSQASTLGGGSLPRSSPDSGPVLDLVSLSTDVLLTPIRWFRPKEGARIHRDLGWTTVGFALRDHGQGLYLQVAGKTQIGKVEIVFEDGGLEQIELGGNRIYDRGLYELASFSNERQVLLVRMQARAWSPKARMQVLLRRVG